VEEGRLEERGRFGGDGFVSGVVWREPLWRGRRQMGGFGRAVSEKTALEGPDPDGTALERFWR